MSWENKEIKLENIKIGKKQEVIFKPLKELPLIKSLSSSCGCSVPTYSKEKRELKVVFTPNPIPKHLQAQGFYNTRKTITVVYIDGTKDVLSFSAKISNK